MYFKILKKFRPSSLNRDCYIGICNILIKYNYSKWNESNEIHTLYIDWNCHENLKDLSIWCTWYIYIFL